MHADMIALVQSSGVDVGGRIGWGWLSASDNTFPRITLTDMAQRHSHSLDGPTGVKSGGVQLDIWAVTQMEALTIGGLIVALFDGFSGVVGGVRFRRVFVDDCALSVERDPARDLGLGRYRIDLLISWETL